MAGVNHEFEAATIQLDTETVAGFVSFFQPKLWATTRIDLLSSPDTAAAKAVLPPPPAHAPPTPEFKPGNILEKEQTSLTPEAKKKLAEIAGLRDQYRSPNPPGPFDFKDHMAMVR